MSAQAQYTCDRKIAPGQYFTNDRNYCGFRLAVSTDKIYVELTENNFPNMHCRNLGLLYIYTQISETIFANEDSQIEVIDKRNFVWTDGDTGIKRLFTYQAF